MLWSPWGMVFHRVTDDVRHLIVATVFHLPHGVHDAALHRFSAIEHVGNRALKDDVGCVSEKPVAEKVGYTEFFVLAVALFGGELSVEVSGSSVSITVSVSVASSSAGTSEAKESSVWSSDEGSCFFTLHPPLHSLRVLLRRCPVR